MKIKLDENLPARLASFAPGTHAGVLLLRLREPGAQALLAAVAAVAEELSSWRTCFVVLTENKVRVKRP